MTGRPAAETDATAGSAALALAQRAVSTADARTRRTDPFTSRSGVGITLAYSQSRDPNTTPSTAIDHACKIDELVALPRPGSGEACLTVRDVRHEVEAVGWIGYDSMNRLVGEVGEYVERVAGVYGVRVHRYGPVTYSRSSTRGKPCSKRSAHACVFCVSPAC